jgi:hypothetical protein
VEELASQLEALAKQLRKGEITSGQYLAQHQVLAAQLDRVNQH